MSINRKIKLKLQELRAENWQRINELLVDGEDDLQLWGRMAAAEEMLEGQLPEDLIFGLHIIKEGDFKTGFMEICKLFKGLI